MLCLHLSFDHLCRYRNSLPGVHIERQQKANYFSILHQWGAAVTRAGKVAWRQDNVGNGPGCVGDSAMHAVPGIFQLDIAKLRLAKFRGLAGAQYGKKGQICIAWNVSHLTMRDSLHEGRACLQRGRCAPGLRLQMPHARGQLPQPRRLSGLQ